MTQTPKDLITERDKTYGVAWWMQGSWIQLVLPQVIDLVNNFPKYFFPWLLITNKCLRILKSPQELDHWKDIQGYAQLVIDDLEKKAKK